MWRKQALDELALVWMATADRPRLNDAVSRIDAALRLNPEVKGVDFYGDRLLVVAPLAVVFMIREEDRIVEVLQTLASPAPRALRSVRNGGAEKGTQPVVFGTGSSAPVAASFKLVRFPGIDSTS